MTCSGMVHELGTEEPFTSTVENEFNKVVGRCESHTPRSHGLLCSEEKDFFEDGTLVATRAVHDDNDDDADKIIANSTENFRFWSSEMDQDLCVVAEAVPPYKIRRVNRQCLLQLGFLEADLIGRTLRILCGPRTDVNKFSSLVEKSILGQDPAVEDIILYARNAVELCVSANARIISSIENSSENVSCVLHFRAKERNAVRLDDVAAHQTAQEHEPAAAHEPTPTVNGPARHTRSRRRLSSARSTCRAGARTSSMPPILEQAPMLILRASPPHPILAANSGIHHLLGFRHGELVGTTARVLHGPATDSAAFAAFLRRASAAATDSADGETPRRAEGPDAAPLPGGWAGGGEEEDSDGEAGEEGWLTLYRKDGEPLPCRCRARWRAIGCCSPRRRCSAPSSPSRRR